MSLLDEQFAFIKDFRKLLSRAEELNFEVSGGELARSIETQQQLHQSGQEATMDSPHIRKCAVNLSFFKESNGRWELIQSYETLKPLGEFWQSLNPRNQWAYSANNKNSLGLFIRDLGSWPLTISSQLAGNESQAEVEAIAVSGDDRPGTIILAKALDKAAQPTIKRGSDKKSAVLYLQQLLIKRGLLQVETGIFEGLTEAAVKRFQAENHLFSDGIVGEKTWLALRAKNESQLTVASKFIGDADFVSAASMLNVETAVVKAVYKVESNGKGFIQDKPKILFEGHVFWERLKLAGKDPAKLSVGNTDILYPKWTRAHYVGGIKEYVRLDKARNIDDDIAQESASWGLFQIMGYHWKLLGYNNIDEFVSKMYEHEREQLTAFCKFVIQKKSKNSGTLRDMLANKDWANFAYFYNGSKYRENRYDDKLKEAYQQAQK